MKLRVEGHPDLIRDQNSKAIIASDKDKYTLYIQEKKFRSQVTSVNDEINNIKDEMSQIKQLLQQLLKDK